MIYKIKKEDLVLAKHVYEQMHRGNSTHPWLVVLNSDDKFVHVVLQDDERTYFFRHGITVILP